MSDRPESLGALRASGYRSRSVRDELRANLLARLASGEAVFPGIVGYEDTVVPQVVNAILSRHHFILLGLRGQAKSRMLRLLPGLLDPEIPVIRGSEINDDPFDPISAYGRQLVGERGDETPVAWIGRESRYVEKLATPDVTIADIIGDLDPVKAARGGRILSDELNIHFGLLPRAHRGIFALNELPDLAGKIQVGLFNVMQEGDVQIKGFPVRLPLDVLMVFTANPEDYTARGKIITPLKDRIGSEIVTHYPEHVESAVDITLQEAWTERTGPRVTVPDFVRRLVERIAFAGRSDARVDHRSGVSQRLPITVMENAVSNAERRGMRLGADEVTVRIGDVYAASSSITGKLELEYEGELQGADKIARELIEDACSRTFDECFVEEDAAPVVSYFEEGGVLQISELAGEEALLEGYGTVSGLVPLARSSALAGAGKESAGALVAACELVLEGLHAKRRISRTNEGWTRRSPARSFRDPPERPR